jgi:hypothetical protein
MMKKKINSLAQSLHHLLEEAKGQPVSVKLVLDTMSGKGQAALLILLALPFCQPIQIPGFSTPFGLILMFIGLRIAFGHRSWIPKKLLDMHISFHVIEKIGSAAIAITDKLSFFTSTRWAYFVDNPVLRIGHGLAIALLAFLLALPIPIPFTNLLAAYPILFFGLALLEDDGIMIVVAYILFYFCLGVFASLIFFGKELGGLV